MGFDLTGHGGEFWWNIFVWPRLLDVAKRYGWKPAGTRLRREDGSIDDSWARGYDSSDFQWVSTEDASALADALERALPDMPDHDALEHKTVPIPEAQARLGPVAAVGDQDVEVAVDVPDAGERGLPLDCEYNPFELFSGENKTHLRKFIAFCRKGGFCIG